MPTPRETILAALQARLPALPVTALLGKWGEGIHLVNPRGSLRGDEPTGTADLQDPELAERQQGAEAPRLAHDRVRSRDWRKGLKPPCRPFCCAAPPRLRSGRP